MNGEGFNCRECTIEARELNSGQRCDSLASQELECGVGIGIASILPILPYKMQCRIHSTSVLRQDSVLLLSIDNGARSRASGVFLTLYQHKLFVAHTRHGSK